MTKGPKNQFFNRKFEILRVFYSFGRYINALLDETNNLRYVIAQVIFHYTTVLLGVKRQHFSSFWDTDRFQVLNKMRMGWFG